MNNRITRALLTVLVAVVGCLIVAEPAHAATDLLIGSTWKPDQTSTRQPNYPGVEISRVFFTGSQCPSWSDSRVQYLKSKGIIPFVSFKLTGSAAQTCLKNMLASLPSDIPVVYIANFHEAEADMSASAYKSLQQADWNVVKASPLHTSGRVKFLSVQTRQWTENKGNSYSTYWCGCGDYFAVDMYVNSWENAYPDPATFVSKVLAFGQSIGYGVFFPELGAIRMPSDPTDTKRAAWINGVIAQLHKYPRFIGAIWWDAIGTPASDGTVRDFSLNQVSGYNDPAAVAWKNALATN